MRILLTGGLGFIGSHIAATCIENNHEICIVDDLSNSSLMIMDALKKIFSYSPPLYIFDINNEDKLSACMANHNIEAVIHLAGHKSVSESCQNPIKYFKNNTCGTMSVVNAMSRNSITKLVYSSSATVYGDPSELPISEDHPLAPTNPYGLSKLMSEQILSSVVSSQPNISVIALRYFNPVGAHSSGLLGESPIGVPNNLMPYLCMVASKEYELLNIYGHDYPTPDGTPIRDYIHVLDIAEGHLKALASLQKSNGIRFYNLGTGQGYSVLQLLRCFERVNNKPIPFQFTNRRPGDVPQSYANPDKALEELGWSACRTLDEMCGSSWDYAKNQHMHHIL